MANDVAMERAMAARRWPLAGLAAGAVTVLVWSLWLVSTRQAATVHLPPAWLGICRFALPAVALLPVWWRFGLVPKGMDLRLLAVMVAGAGAPFLLVAAIGMRFAGAGESGVLLGGSMPLFAAVFSGLIDGERFGPSRIFGFVLVIAAMAAIGGAALVEGSGLGRFLVLIGAALWAGYTIAFRKSGLPALAAAGIIAAWSTLLFLPLAAYEGLAPLRAVGPAVVIGQVVAQGLLSGIVALACYGVAIRTLGSSRAALLAALPPALAALLAVPLLGEAPTPLALLGVALSVLGVALASGAIGFGRG